MANLIGFDKNRDNVEFRGPCKLSINFMSNYLNVEPKNEEFKLISASFKWNYVVKKNLLFVFSEHNFLDFCLVFKNEQICKKTLDYIKTAKKDTDTTDEASIDTSFFNPIFEAISINPHINSDLIETIAGWHQLLDESDKEKYSSLMTEFSIYDLIMTAVPTEQQQKNACKSRKRKYADIKKEVMPKKEFKKEMSVKNIGLYAKVISATQFQLFSISILQKLVVYASNQKEAFYEYNFVPNNNEFKCVTCDQTALIDIDDNGDFCVKLVNDKHSCELSTEIPSNYQNIKLIQKPDYQIFENCAMISSKVLVVFDSDERTQCYQYRSKKSYLKFCCWSCYRSKLSNRSSAYIFNVGTSKEYVGIINGNHECKSKTFQPEKYRQCYDYILKPNFEIQKFHYNGKEVKRLVIYDSTDSSKCYRYVYRPKKEKFYCYGCVYKGKWVAAKLHQNSESEEYIILSNAKHVCEMKTYIPLNNVIFRPPEIEVMEETKNGKPRVFLFEEGGRSKCYIFYYERGVYYCVGCASKTESNRKQKKQNTEFKNITGKLLKEETGEYSFRMNANQIHCCKPRPYQPEKYEVQSVSKTADFFYYRLKNELKTVKLAIYSPENNLLCFTFVYEKCKNCFICIECRKMKKYYYMKPQKDSDGKEYYNHNVKKHICEPIKVSSISKSDILKEHGLNFEQKSQIEDSKIVRMSNFELRPNKNGIADRKLIVRHSNDQTLCYEFFFDTVHQIFKCSKCHKKKRAVSAKLHTDDENGKSFIVMGKNDHVCEPQKYQSL